jgi:hypothetical protein
MNVPNDDTAPSRTGIRRIFPPWEYRHLRAWAAFFFACGALSLAAGYWELTIARSVPPRV